jgi:mannose-6-phosphate isomerase-like protein (cupin superfamily)
MIIHRKDMTVEHTDKLLGGEGITTRVHFVDPPKLKNARLLAQMTLPPGASIGEHQHNSETEYYLILSGTGQVNDNGHAQTVVPGDVVVTGNGDRHSILNNGIEPLVFHAVIMTY